MLRAVLEEADGGVTERMCLCSLRMNRRFPYGWMRKAFQGKTIYMQRHRTTVYNRHNVCYVVPAYVTWCHLSEQ